MIKDYAKTVYLLIHSINLCKKDTLSENQQLAIDEFIKYFKGESDIDTLNDYLPQLYTSSFKNTISNWLRLKQMNPNLEKIRFEPPLFNLSSEKTNSEYRLWSLPLFSKYLCHGLIVGGFFGLLFSGIQSISLLFLASMLLALAVIAVEKFFHHYHASQCLTPSTFCSLK